VWKLALGEVYPDAYESVVIRAEREDGEQVVLRVQFPGRENEHAADALRLWDGDGAVRMLDRDDERDAFLLERCDPGTPLHDLQADEALDVVVDLLPRLWKPAGEPFRRMEDEAVWWASSLPTDWERIGRPFERRLLDAALLEIDGLTTTAPSERVLLHQDLHAGNVLRAARRPWLVIDPKPLAGERALGLAALIRGWELGSRREDVLHRLDRLTSELGLDRDRSRRWAFAQTLAWSFGDEDDVIEHNVNVATWLLDAD